MMLIYFIKKGQVRKATPDIALIKSLVKTAEADMLFLKSVEVNELSARKVMSNYYDTLRSILEAMAALDGFKVYSHEAFKHFLSEKGEHIIAEKFDRFRKIRNKINYYGKSISKEEVVENSTEIASLITQLKEKYLKETAT